MENILFGGLLFYSSFLFNAVPDAGWFAYVPLSGPRYSPGLGLDFWLLALGVSEIGAIAFGVEIIIAGLSLRPPGMSLSRMSLYAWAMLITAFAILFAFTPLMIGSGLLEFDRQLWAATRGLRWSTPIRAATTTRTCTCWAAACSRPPVPPTRL